MPTIDLSFDEPLTLTLDGRPVVLRVLGYSHNAVRIGIQADKSIPIHRGEIARGIAAGGVVPGEGGAGEGLVRRVGERKGAEG